MLSLDGARRQLVLHGEALLASTIAASRRTAEAIDEIPGCRVVGDEEIGRPGVAGRDPLRIVIDVRGTGATGYEMAAALRSNFDTQVELATQATIVLVLGIDEPPRELERFIHDLSWHRRRGWSSPGETEEVTLATGTFENEVVMPPRDAFLGESTSSRSTTSIGRVSAEAIAGYPPGIPVLLPGRADHRRGDRVPALAEGRRRAPARRQRPRLQDDPRAQAVSRVRRVRGQAGSGGRGPASRIRARPRAVRTA